MAVIAGYPLLAMKVTIFDGSYPRCRLQRNGVQDRRLDGGQGRREESGSRAARTDHEAVEVVTPEDYMGDVIGDLNRRRGLILGMDDNSSGKVITAEVPLAEMFGYAPTCAPRRRGAPPTRWSSRSTRKRRTTSRKKSLPGTSPEYFTRSPDEVASHGEGKV
jgi:translation elongation factor EF-G